MTTNPDPTLQSVAKMAGYVVTHIERGDPSTAPELRKDLSTLRDDIDTVLGPEESPEMQALGMLLEGQADIVEMILKGQEHDDGILVPLARQVAALYRRLVPPPSGTWTFEHLGTTFSGRNPMALTIKDTDILGTPTQWKGKFTPEDTLGEVDPNAKIAFSVADATLVAFTDNGDGTFALGSALVAGTGQVLPAATELHAQTTDPDGTTGDFSDVITVEASDASQGAFSYAQGS